MNKSQVKVIKRKDAEAAGNARGSRPRVLVRKDKLECRSQRRIKATVSSWITARRKLTRMEEIAAVHKVFGNEILLGTT